MPRRNSTFFAELGPGGFSSLALASLSAAAGLGIPVVIRLRQLLRRVAAADPSPADLIVVFGRELIDDRPTVEFETRLDYAAELWRSGSAPRILVSGGLTGTATRSEAAAGRDHLVSRGVDSAAIWTEERSRHTLENLFFVRQAMRERGLREALLVSDPLHLGRAAVLADGLGLDCRCAPAIASPPRRGSAGWWARASRQAFLLHWYHVGVAYSRWLGSERLLSRVT